MSKRRFYLFFLSVILSITLFSHNVFAFSIDFGPYIILSDYELTLNIGDEVFITPFVSTGKYPTWSSSNSRIASVNRYGMVTAKRDGNVTIKAKIKGAEARCNITVNKTSVTLSKTNISLERGESFTVSASSSTQSPILWKTSRKSIATVDDSGRITALKPGETVISATADTTKATLRVTVVKPTIKLNKSSVKLYRGQTVTLSATVSSNISPKFKTNRKSVATVDSLGKITAVKHGTAIITATLDGISKTCMVTVESPTITLNDYELTLKTGDSFTLKAKTSSGNPVTYSTSNSKVIKITSEGKITSLKKGRAYVYASEDGTKVKCTVYVTN